MSYYSTVAITFPVRYFDKFNENGAKVTNFNYLMELADIKYSHTDYVVLYWDYVKWYGDEVDYINDFLKSIEGQYDFVRLGEESDDIEDLQFTGEYIIEPVREIKINS